MAAPNKTGLDYYPRAINFLSDRRFTALRIKCGNLPVSLYEQLLDIIYADNGYFISIEGEKREELVLELWDRFGKYDNLSIEKVDSIFNDVCAAMFNRELYEKGILTSHEIQCVFYTATLKRKNVKVNRDIWLLDMEQMLSLGKKSSILRLFEENTAQQDDTADTNDSLEGQADTVGANDNSEGLADTVGANDNSEGQTDAIGVNDNPAEQSDSQSRINDNPKTPDDTLSRINDNPKIPDDTLSRINDVINPQSKVNQSKVNQSKVNQTKINQTNYDGSQGEPVSAVGLDTVWEEYKKTYGAVSDNDRKVIMQLIRHIDAPVMADTIRYCRENNKAFNYCLGIIKRLIQSGTTTLELYKQREKSMLGSDKNSRFVNYNQPVYTDAEIAAAIKRKKQQAKNIS